MRIGSRDPSNRTDDRMPESTIARFALVRAGASLTAGRCCLARPAGLLPPGSSAQRAPSDTPRRWRPGVARDLTPRSRVGSSACCGTPCGIPARTRLGPSCT
jgi:hypothetical protein